MNEMKQTYTVKIETLDDTFYTVNITFPKQATLFDYFVYQEKMYWITEVSGEQLEAVEQDEVIHIAE